MASTSGSSGVISSNSLQSQAIYYPPSLNASALLEGTGSKHLKFVKNIAQLEGGGSFIGKRSMRKYCKSFPQWPVDKIVEVTRDPTRIAMMKKGELFHSFILKLREFIKDLQKMQHSQTKIRILPLNRFVVQTDDGKGLFLIEKLIQQVLASDDCSLQFRAAHALFLLEKIDPTLSTLNHLIVRFLHSLDISEKVRAESVLKNFIAYPPAKTMSSFPLKPHVISRNALNCSPLFPSNMCAASSSQEAFADFWKIQAIIVGSFAGCYFDNLRDIAAIEGIPEVFQATQVEWLRDAFLVLDNRKILVPCRIQLMHSEDSFFTLAFDKKQMKLAHMIQHLTADPAVMIMGSVAMEDASLKILNAGFNAEVSEAPFYFEGGNLLPVIHPNGHKVYLCGAHNLLFSLLNSNSIFSTREARSALLEEVKGIVDQDEIAIVRERMERAGLLFDFATDQDKEFLAKLTLASILQIKMKMETYLGCPVIVLGHVFQSPVEFHLDMFVLPFFNHVIFIQDHALCQKVLMDLSQRSDLNPYEQERLSIYLKFAEERHRIDGERLAGIAEMLKNEGFQVVPIPGNYYEELQKPAVSFLNAILGVGAHHSYCISNGSSHPFDRHLRNVFASILKSQGVDHVYFTGRKSDQEVSTYRAADEGLKKMGGVHCRTQEINSLVKGMDLNTSVREAAKIPARILGFFDKHFETFYREMLEMHYSSTSL